MIIPNDDRPKSGLMKVHKTAIHNPSFPVLSSVSCRKSEKGIGAIGLLGQGKCTVITEEL